MIALPMNKFLDRRKVLLFCPAGDRGKRGKEFRQCLTGLGAEVKVYDERPSGSTFSKIILRLLKKKVPAIFNNYIKSIIKAEHVEFDYIIVIRGEAFTPSTIKVLREAYPKAKMILYLWDILETNDLRDIIPMFDSVYCFDPEDTANNKGVKFRPLYSMDLYREGSNNDVDKNIDLSFIGTIHSDRAKILNQIDKYCRKENLNFYQYKYVRSRLIWLKEKICKFPFMSYSETKFIGASQDKILEVSLRSKALLDINYYDQKSLSMRPFEAMMLQRKFITTNPEIVKYDFYDSRNILVIDPENINIPKSFLNTPFVPISSDILEKYTSQYLMETLLGMHEEVEYLK